MSQQARAVVARAKGDPVTVETIVVPDPGPGEAVVRVQAVDSIRTRLLTLPEDTVVHPGHGPTTTIADEKANLAVS